MKRFLIAAYFVIMGSTSAWAQTNCTTTGGYAYVYTICRDCVKLKDSYFVHSNVAYTSSDYRKTGQKSKFFDATQESLDVSINGEQSNCYESRSEAEDRLRRHVAEMRRDGYKVREVYIKSD